MRTLVLALRNVLRHKRQSLLVLAALILGVAGLVVFQGFLSEMMRQWRDSSIAQGIGHVQVAGREAYWDDGVFNPFAYPLRNADTLAERLRAQPGVRAVFPSTGFVAIAGFGERSKTLLVKGFPADRMTFATPLEPELPGNKFVLGSLDSGRPLAVGQRDTLLLGSTSARVLGVHVGDVLTLMAVLPGGQLAGRDFRVGGTFAVLPGDNDLLAYTDYQTAADLIQLTQPPVLNVLLDSVDRVPAVVAALPKGVAVRTWRDLDTLFVQVNSMLEGFLTVIRAILLIVTLFILANTMNRIVRERLREWGTLRVLGTPQRSVVALVIAEGALMGLVGSLLGVILGFALAGAIDLGGGIAFHQGTMDRVVLVRPGLDTVAANVVPAVLVAALAAILPGLRSVRLSPAECLREG